MLFHSGMFGPGITMVPQEFTPKDIMQLKIFDDNYVLPPECEINDPELPYCQLDGLYKIFPTYYNQIEPYDHMNEHCPSKAPFYERPDGC